jgi:hypothetical protein
MSLRLLRHLFVPHRSSLFRPQPGWFRLRLLAKHQHWRLDVHAVAHPNNSLSESSSSVLNVPWARSCDLAHILSLQDPSIPLCATRSVRPAWAAHIRAAPPRFSCRPLSAQTRSKARARRAFAQQCLLGQQLAGTLRQLPENCEVLGRRGIGVPSRRSCPARRSSWNGGKSIVVAGTRCGETLAPGCES